MPPELTQEEREHILLEERERAAARLQIQQELKSHRAKRNWGGVAVLGMLALMITVISQLPPSSETSSVVSSALDQERARERFITLLKEMKLSALILSVTIGPTPHELQIQTPASWHSEPYQIRLQAAQVLWKLWVQADKPPRPDDARIRLVDLMGNEVGGSRLLGGSLIWVQEK